MGHRTEGFTLLELLLVMALIGLLSVVAAWSGQYLARGWQLKRSGHQLYEDLSRLCHLFLRAFCY